MIKDYISVLENWYRKVWRFNTYNRYLWVKAHALDTPVGMSVLDVGVGSGQYRKLFNHCVYKTQDFCKELDSIGKYTHLDYISDITAIAVPDESFDVLLCTEVLEHVPEPIKAVKELARILKSGGKLFLTAPLGSFLHQEPYHFYGGFTPHWYSKFLPENGLDIISIEKNRGFFSFLGQEIQRSNYYLSPFNNRRKKLFISVMLMPLWLGTWPLKVAFPLLGYGLDKLKLEDENFSTVGYHVTAVKRC